MRTITTIALALGGMALSAYGQGASRLTTPSGDQKKQLEQAAEKLRQAQANGDLDKAKEKAKGLMGNIPGNLTDAAKAALQSPEVKAQAAEAAKAAAKTLLPEAQKLMGGSAPADAPPAAAPTTPAAGAAAVQEAVPEGPKPQALQPLNDSPPGVAANKKPMAVIEADSSVFDSNTGILIYSGNVRARHPQFYIECEELVVHLDTESGKEKDADGKPKAKPAPANDPISAKKKGEESPRQNSVKKAIATGPMVRIEKANEQGELQRAFCRHAVYESSTGIITMRDNPQVQNGNVMQVAITPDTVMTFDQKGNFNSNRRTRTVILSEGEGAGASRNNL